jgi:hypothetical protein
MNDDHLRAAAIIAKSRTQRAKTFKVPSKPRSVMH